MECLECGKKLNKKNKCGYCQEHKDLSPQRIKWKKKYRQTEEFKEREKQKDKKRYYEGKRNKSLKKYKQKNRNEINKRRREDRKKDPEKYKEYDKRKNEKESRKIWNREYYKKLKKKPEYVLSINFSSSMRRALKENKNGLHWEELVDYTLKDLTEHLERISEFTLEDYLKEDLHIDHIIPINAYSFNGYKNEEFKKCWDLRNLRIIRATENVKKQDLIDKELIEKYNIEDLLPEGIFI